MDALIFTPRQADFLKDGSIFAQSPAKTSNIVLKPHLPTADSNRFASFANTVSLYSHKGQWRTCVPCMTRNASRGAYLMLSAACGPRSELEVASASASQAPFLHAPQPRFPSSHSHSKPAWAPEDAGSPQLPSGQDDMAKQIRAKFENLVRASPLPKVAIITCSVSASVAACKLSCFSSILPLACTILYRWLSSWSVHEAFSRLLSVADSAEMLAGHHHGMHGRH